MKNKSSKHTYASQKRAYPLMKVKVKSLSCVQLFAIPWPVTCTRLLRPWDSPGNNTGVGCHFLLQGIFLTQGSNPCLPHCRQMSYPLSHQGSPDGLFSKQSTLMNESTVNNYIFIITCICIVCKLYLYICCCFSLYLSSVYLPAYLENLYIYIYIYILLYIYLYIFFLILKTNS